MTFTISSPDADVVAAFDDLLVDFRSGGVSQTAPSVRFAVEATQPDDTDQTWYRVTAGDEVVYTSLLEGSLVSHLLMDVNARASVACRAAGTVPLHAGTVAGAHGAIVLPGASHSGKTTITTALAACGAPIRRRRGQPARPRPAHHRALRQAGGVAFGIGRTVGADHRQAPPARKSLRDRRALRSSLRTRVAGDRRCGRSHGGSGDRSRSRYRRSCFLATTQTGRTASLHSARPRPSNG